MHRDGKERSRAITEMTDRQTRIPKHPDQDALKNSEKCRISCGMGRRRKMLNREKYAKEIAEIACNGKHIAIVAGKPMLCYEASCDTCDIEYNCTRGLKEWANSEYVEPQVDWSKVPVDTPILVKIIGGDKYERRYFSRFEDGKVYAWNNGMASWTTAMDTAWDYAKLAESEDQNVNKQN